MQSTAKSRSSIIAAVMQYTFLDFSYQEYLHLSELTMMAEPRERDGFHQISYHR